MWADDDNTLLYLLSVLIILFLIVLFLIVWFMSQPITFSILDYVVHLTLFQALGFAGIIFGIAFTLVYILSNQE